MAGTRFLFHAKELRADFMHYRSINDLNRDIIHNLHRLPRNIDVVVGIPRSGLLVANIIALTLNLPMADLEGFAAGRLLSSGKTRRRDALDIGFGDLKHALVVDDSTHMGGALQEARRVVKHLSEELQITYAVVYKPEGQVDHDLIAFETVPVPRVFEWNLFHHAVLREACVDIDGVLCHDPFESENDDGDNYVKFLLSARPRCFPTQRIGHLVTSRLEKYRVQTETWLANHGVTYDKLIMLDLPDGETRQRLAVHGRFKGEYYRRTKSPLFIESEAHQAAEIARISGKDVLCTADHTLYKPSALSPLRVAQSVRQQNLRDVARSVLGPDLSRGIKKLLSR